MTDQEIIDTIVEALWVNKHGPNWLADRTEFMKDAPRDAAAILAALRSAGCRVTADRCEKDYHSTPHTGCVLR